MWDQATRQLFKDLRQRERDRTLTPEEKTRLLSLYREIEDEEKSSLGPATTRKDEEATRLRALNDALRDTIRRKEEHLALMRTTADQWHQEREKLDSELDRLFEQVEAEVAA